MSKSFKKFLKFLVAGLLGLFMFYAMDPITAEAADLYFDDEGNLYFHTRDKKATGGTKYMTIGWVIKRYDMPMDAPGQQYVIVTKKTYKQDEVDPEDSKYVYCYFKTDKDEILGAVKTVSNNWYNQLYYYGDEVYIDSVMTVVKSGNALGTLYKGGTYTGEVYFTYEGIAGARNWSSPQSLKAHYDMVVVFPVLQKPVGAYVRIDSEETVTVQNRNMMSFIRGAGEYGEEPYDITSGIPSGEDIYLKGLATSGIFQVELKRIEGTYITSIAVPVTYRVSWTDYEGAARTEQKTVNKYYTVSRKFSYYEYVDMEMCSLKEAIFSDDMWQNKMMDISIEDIELPVDIQQTSDISIYCREIPCIYLGEICSVEKGIKPSVPDVDYSYIVEQAVGNVYVRNDGVVIDGVTILENGWTESNGEKPEMSPSIGVCNIYETGITIPAEVLNGIYYGATVELIYESDDGTTREFQYTAMAPIHVHTPVYCSAFIEGQAVAGSTMNIIFSDVGNHRDILGYGYRSYREYVGQRMISCAFPVEYQGVSYEAGQIIAINGSSAELIVPKYIEPGEYEVKVYVWAHNAGDEQAEMIERTANISPEKYGAWDTIPISLISMKQLAHSIYEVSGTH